MIYHWWLLPTCASPEKLKEPLWKKDPPGAGEQHSFQFSLRELSFANVIYRPCNTEDYGWRITLTRFSSIAWRHCSTYFFLRCNSLAWCLSSFNRAISSSLSLCIKPRFERLAVRLLSVKEGGKKQQGMIDNWGQEIKKVVSILDVQVSHRLSPVTIISPYDIFSM